MANKGHIRSIRFSDELYELIDRQAGDTFTKKLENLVTKCVWELPAKEKQLASLQEQITEARNDLSRIQSMRHRIEDRAYYLDASLRNTVEQIKRYEEQITTIVNEM